MAASKLKIISILLLLSVLQVVYAQDSTTEVKVKSNSVQLGVVNGMAHEPYSYTLTFGKQKNHFTFYGGIKFFNSNISVYDGSQIGRVHDKRWERLGLIGGVKYYPNKHIINKISPFLQLNLQGSLYNYGGYWVNDDFDPDNSFTWHLGYLTGSSKYYVLDIAFAYGVKYKIYKSLYFSNSFGFQTAYRRIDDGTVVDFNRVKYDEVNIIKFNGQARLSHPFFFSIETSYLF